MNFTIVYTVATIGFMLSLPHSRAENAVSENAAVAYTFTVPAAGAYALVALSHEAFGGGDLTLLEMFGTNQLRKSGVKTLVDRVMIYDPLGTPTPGYRTYGQKPDGLFYNVDAWTGAPITNRFAPGTGFWLSQPTSAASNKVIRLFGQVVDSPSSTKAVIAGMQMIGGLYSAPLVLTNNSWLADGAVGNNVKTLCDRIMIFNGTSYSELGLRADGHWRFISNPDQWTTGPDIVEALAVGQGAWYRARTSFNWSETKPYSYP